MPGMGPSLCNSAATGIRSFFLRLDFGFVHDLMVSPRLPLECPPGDTAPNPRKAEIQQGSALSAGLPFALHSERAFEMNQSPADRARRTRLMMSIRRSITTVAFVLGLGFVTSEADAQRGRGNDRDRDRVEERARGREDVLRRDGRVRGNGSGKVPPGWCRGVGNPHNTVENCGYSSSRDRRYYHGDYGYGGRSNEAAHVRFQRELDERYHRLGARRPLDVVYQLELRSRRHREHEDWHYRTGTRH
jgi:hypothetical protein